MSLRKTPQEIEKMKRGGEHLSRILREIRAACIPGVGTAELDKIARDRMAEVGGRPSFLGYQIEKSDPPYPGALCISINEEVVHGLAIPNRIIQAGDVVGLDIGMWYEGLATDMAMTVIAGGTHNPKVTALVQATREALKRGIEAIQPGKDVGIIGATIEDFIRPTGFGIVKDLVGHGVGHAVHEAPNVPNYRERHLPPQTLEVGMALAIEPMITMGGWRVRMKRDGWTIVTMDNSLCAHFELTVAVTETGYELVTPWPDA